MVLGFIFSVFVATPVSLWIYSWYITDVPKYYTKYGSKLDQKVKSNLVLLKEKYRPSWWCPFGTFQTVIREVLRNCPSLPYVREIVEFEDGGAAGIDWLIPKDADNNSPIVFFLPGLTGSSHDSSYLLHPVIEAYNIGWRSVVVNPRGLGGVKLRTTRTYNAAMPHDFAHIAQLVHERFPEARKLGCGFSMGGMILWNYLAAAGDNALIDGAMIVSSPWDAKVATDSIESFIPNCIFNRFMARNLVKFIQPYRDMFHELVDFDQVLQSTSLRQFDQAFVAPIFGFKGYEEYYEKATLRTKVNQIRRPTITLNAVDDYFCPVNCIPVEEMLENENVVGIITNHGGHIGFMESANPNAPGIVERMLCQWGNLIFNDYP